MKQRLPLPARAAGLVILSVANLCVSGCAWVAQMGSDERGLTAGKTFYLGGAGPFGHVGSFDVPDGLRKGGYLGAIEVYPWQSWIGWTIRDQIDRYRNDSQGRKLAIKICEYLDEYPDRPVNIVALSAGTGIATWALEHLPPRYRVNHVVFFSSSLSRTYDLSLALRRIDGRMYSFFSPADSILKYAVPLAGSVDRAEGDTGVGGLTGFVPATGARPETLELYEARLRNMPWRQTYSRYGYDGGHTDATSAEFVRRVVTPLLMKRPANDRVRAPVAAPATRPADEQPTPPDDAIQADKTRSPERAPVESSTSRPAESGLAPVP